VAVTAAALALLWLGMWVSLGHGYWITLLLAVPAALTDRAISSVRNVAARRYGGL